MYRRAAILDNMYRFAGTWPINSGIAAEATVGKYGKTAKLPRHGQILYAVAYVFAMFAASPALVMESTRGVVEGRPPCGGGRRPPPLWVLGWEWPGVRRSRVSIEQRQATEYVLLVMDANTSQSKSDG